MNKKRIGIAILVCSALFTLTGCFGSDVAETDVPTGFHEYKTDEVSIQIPNSWEVISPQQFLSNVPAGTLIAFRNNVRDSVYTASVVAVKNELPAAVSTMDFSKTLLEKTKSELFDYQEVTRETVQIHSGQDVTETIFSHGKGKSSPDSEPQDWFQISVVKGQSAYIATGSLLSDSDAAIKDLVEKMVRSFNAR